MRARYRFPTILRCIAQASMYFADPADARPAGVRQPRSSSSAAATATGTAYYYSMSLLCPRAPPCFASCSAGATRRGCVVPRFATRDPPVHGRYVSCPRRRVCPCRGKGVDLHVSYRSISLNVSAVLRVCQRGVPRLVTEPFFFCSVECVPFSWFSSPTLCGFWWCLLCHAGYRQA